MSIVINQTVILNTEDHTYWGGDTEYLSVTRWIKSHWPDFNPDEEMQWGPNRGKSIASATAKNVSREIKGEGPITKKYEDPYYYTKRLFGDSWEEEVEARKEKKIPVNAKDVKKYWALKGQASAEEGTRVHDLIEKAILGELDLVDYMDERRVVAAVNFLNKLLNLYGADCTVSPEEIIHSKELGLAGTIDLLIETDGGIVLVDWKTNEEIKELGYQRGLTQATEQYKIHDLLRYSLQLSVYAYMLEIQGYAVKKLWLYHLGPHDCNAIEIEYMRDLVEAMLREDGRLE